MIAGLLSLLPSLTNVASDVISRVLPGVKMSEEDTAKFKAEFQVALMSQENKELETRMSAILAEAKSSDPWTSRARPSFMYVFYLLLLASIPMGILSAFNPLAAAAIISGFQGWLAAIPTALYGLFGTGYVGYAAARSWDKTKQLQAKKW